MSVIKYILSGILLFWSLSVVALYILTVSNIELYTGLGAVVNIMIMANIGVIFFGSLGIILDQIFTSRLSSFTRTFGVMVITLFLISTILSVVPGVRGSTFEQIGSNITWFLSVFLCVYVFSRKRLSESKA